MLQLILVHEDDHRPMLIAEINAFACCQRRRFASIPALVGQLYRTVGYIAVRWFGCMRIEGLRIHLLYVLVRCVGAIPVVRPKTD